MDETGRQPPSRPFSLAALSFFHWAIQGVGKRLAPSYRPRRFSNQVLREYLKTLGGDIINVSGWRDSDKEDGLYRDYFGWRKRYVVSHISGEAATPLQDTPEVEPVYLDLEEPSPPHFVRAFDVVFSHTVLEHVFDTRRALESMDQMCRDTVVLVVPFAQAVHYSRSYGDYVRPSPLLLKRFFEERGYSVLLCTCNDQPLFPIYVVFIASRNPERHKNAFQSAPRSFEVQISPARWGRYGNGGLTAMKDE